MTEQINPINPKDYHYDGKEIVERAMENLKGHKPYQKLKDELKRLDPRRDFVKRNLLQTQMRKIEEDEMHRLIALEEKRQMDVNAIADMLKELSPDDHRRYQELMAGLAMAIDVLDYTFTDINGLLYRNGIGVQMFQFPEVAAARKMLSDLADMEQEKMPEYKRTEYVAESDRLWEHLKERTAVYVRKIDRIESKHPELVKE